MTLWIPLAPVGFGFAACTQPAEAQLPQAMIALAPAAASSVICKALLPPTQQ